MAGTSKFSYSDMQNPLFLHPSDSPLSISVTKLQGAGDFRSWKRSIEIQLCAKRKLGFVDGTIKRSTEDAVEASQWDTCNNMVISWLHNNISDTIKKSVLFINNAAEIWRQLEKRFSLIDGSRKYKLTKDLFSLKQNGSTVTEYFTALSALWKEIESMHTLPTISNVTKEMTKFLKAIESMREESKLFQFLNGLDDCYAPQRSQILMFSPLPSVERACSVIQQEENQRDVLNVGQEMEMSAMFSKGASGQAERDFQCTACGSKGHTQEHCWSVKGFPKWHYKYGKKPFVKPNPNRWNSNKAATGGKPKYPKMANAVQGGYENSAGLSPQQLEELLKLVPAHCKL